MEKYKNLNEQQTEKQLITDIEKIKKEDSLTLEAALELFLNTLIYDDDIILIANNLGLLHIEKTYYFEKKMSILEIITRELYEFVSDLAYENLE